MINWGSDYFDSKNLSDSRLNIELILSHVLNCDRMKLYLDYDKPLLSKELSEIKELVRRRAKREPIQYIMGSSQFLNHKIFLNNSVLIPRPETEFLVELVFNKISEDKIINILDIGSGSACIGIALAHKYKNSHITSLDISKDAIDIAKINSLENNVSNITFLEMDILKDIPTSKFDVIVSNPPYISESEYLSCEPEVKYYEPKNALSDFGDGLSFYRRFDKIFNELLNDDGMFFLEIAYNQKEELKSVFQSSYKIDIYNDFSNLPRYIIGEKMKKY